MSSRRDGDLIGGGKLHEDQAINANANGKSLFKPDSSRLTFGVWFDDTAAGTLALLQEVTTNAPYVRARWEKTTSIVYFEGSSTKPSAPGVQRWATITSSDLSGVTGGSTTVSVDVAVTYER